MGGLRNSPLLSTTSVDFNRNVFMIHDLLTASKEEAAQPSVLKLTRIFIWKPTRTKQTIHSLPTLPGLVLPSSSKVIGL